jgi:hypothetical protein
MRVAMPICVPFTSGPPEALPPNVRSPLSTGRPLMPRLLTLPAVLLPYALLVAAAKSG